MIAIVATLEHNAVTVSIVSLAILIMKMLPRRYLNPGPHAIAACALTTEVWEGVRQVGNFTDTD